MLRTTLVLGLVLSYPAQVSARDFVVDWTVAAKEAARKGYCFVTVKEGGDHYFAVNGGGNASSQLRFSAPNRIDAQISNGNQLQTGLSGRTTFYLFAGFPMFQNGRKPTPVAPFNYRCARGIKWPSRPLVDGWSVKDLSLNTFPYSWLAPSNYVGRSITARFSLKYQASNSSTAHCCPN